MNCNLPKITYPTLRTLLLLKIYEAICQKKDVEVANDVIGHPNVQPNVPDFEVFRQEPILRKVINQTSVATYRSSIALQLAAGSSQTRIKIAYQVVQFFQSSPFNSSERDIETALLRDLTVSNTETGQLAFEFGDRAIALWLQTVLNECARRIVPDRNSLPDETLSENPQIFLCQYSYARCSALCHLGSLSNFMGQRADLEWLRDGKLLFKKERSLVAQIVTTLDKWEDGEALESAIALSQAFQAFYRDCRIVKYDTVDPQIASCRLALVMITQWLLKQLLEQGIGVLAPETL